MGLEVIGAVIVGLIGAVWFVTYLLQRRKSRRGAVGGKGQGR
jgi:hypothetical protein